MNRETSLVAAEMLHGILPDLRTILLSMCPQLRQQCLATDALGKSQHVVAFRYPTGTGSPCVDQQGRTVIAAEIDGRREPCRACANDDHLRPSIRPFQELLSLEPARVPAGKPAVAPSIEAPTGGRMEMQLRWWIRTWSPDIQVICSSIRYAHHNA